MTESVCHQCFDLSMGHVSALLPTLQRAWNENQRAFDSSALAKLRVAHLQVCATVGDYDGTEAIETTIEKDSESMRCKSLNPEPRENLRKQALSTVPASYVNCHMVWRNPDKRGCCGEVTKFKFRVTESTVQKGKVSKAGHQELNIIVVTNKQINK